MSVTYPFLQDDPAPAPAVAAAPPAEPEYNLEPLRTHCAVCGRDVDTDKAHTVLECGHLMHFACTRALFVRSKKLPDSIGGPRWCSTCGEVNAATGQYAYDPSLGHERILGSLRAMHVKQFHRDIENEIAQGSPSAELERKLLGRKSLGSRFATAVGSLAATVRRQDDEAAWTDEPEFDQSTIVARMEAAGRTLDVVFETTDADIADLHNAGVDSLDGLRRLGFSESLHLTEPYRKRLPVFALVTHYGLGWRHLKHLSPKAVRAFRLSAPELRLMDCDMQQLLLAKWDAKDVLHMGVAPSKLVKYLNMQLVHLNTLGLSLDKFTKNKTWLRDFENHDGAFYRLVVS